MHRICVSLPHAFDYSSSHFSSPMWLGKMKYTKNTLSFKWRISNAKSSHMAELNGEFSISKLLWLMIDRGCNSSPVMALTGYKCTLPFFLFLCLDLLPLQKDVFKGTVRALSPPPNVSKNSHLDQKCCLGFLSLQSTGSDSWAEHTFLIKIMPFAYVAILPALNH